MGEETKDEFVCYPVLLGVGYVHPLDIITVVDMGMNAATMYIRTTNEQPLEVLLTCSAYELHRRRMAAFAYVREQQMKLMHAPFRGSEMTGSA